VKETLTLFAAFYRSPRPISEVITLVGLAGREHARLGTLSGGQRRRADVAVALVGDPELIFLDEPTTGFDPTARREAWQTIQGLKELGKTVLLTTHYMEEAQYLADRVAIIRAGEIVAEGRPEEITRERRSRAIIGFDAPEGVQPAQLAAAATHPVSLENGRMTLEADDAQATLLRLTQWADRAHVDLGAIEVRQPSLEDVFLELTQSEAAADG